MLLVPGEAGELVADLDDAVLVWFKEEADVSVVGYRDAFVLRGFLGCQLHMGVYPGLPPHVSITRCILEPIAYLWAALFLQVDQCRTPRPCSKYYLVCVILCAILSLDSDTCCSIAIKHWAFEGACADPGCENQLIRSSSN